MPYFFNHYLTHYSLKSHSEPDKEANLTRKIHANKEDYI
jgi:hypothetical protein